MSLVGQSTDQVLQLQEVFVALVVPVVGRVAVGGGVVAARTSRGVGASGDQRAIGYSIGSCCAGDVWGVGHADAGPVDYFTVHGSKSLLETLYRHFVHFKQFP